MEKSKKILLFLVGLLILSRSLNYIEPKYSYIKSVNVSEPLRSSIVQFISESDAASGGAFSRKSIRPITIRVGPLSPEKLAESWLTPFFCRITLSSDISWIRSSPIFLKTTLLHELGHCFGFIYHEKSPSSVMYYTDSSLINSASIKEFLVRLKERANW